METPELPASYPQPHHGRGETTRSSSDSNFAFLVHSQDSLASSSPPDIDNQRLARQKRRRTSPEDQAILEAAYQRDRKPDKTTRLEIVRSVALGEKEVQIWFQNRRQLTRRKSQVPCANESSQDVFSQDEVLPRLDSTEPSFSSTVPLNFSSQGSLAHSQNSESSRPDEQEDVLATQSCGEAVKRPDGLCQTFKIDGQGMMRPRDPPDSVKCSSPGKKALGYLANRRNAPFIIHEDISACRVRQTSSSESYCGIVDRSPQHKADQPLRRTVSLVKLSTDPEGKAEITPRTGDTPSPPKAKSVAETMLQGKRNAGLQRSYSAVEPRNLSGSSSGILGSMKQRQHLGRSKDARTWEFYCDSSAREALNTQAKREETGSAAAAIDLIRSHSGHRKALVPNPNKRNAQAHKHEPAKRYKSDLIKAGRPQLERATTSIGRLQSTEQSGKATKSNVTSSKKHKKSCSQPAIFEDFEGDSDKENWQPGTQTRAPPRRRPVTNPETARILLESLQEPSASSSWGEGSRRGSSRMRTEVKDKENAAPEIDDEVASFMGETSLPRQEEDLDCVQNLLSLSKAAWV